MRNRLLWLISIALIGAALLYLERVAGGWLLARLLSLTAIWAVAAVALNLTNGTAGLPNLGQHGFMLVGAYVTALLTSPKTTAFLMAPWAQSLNLNWLSQSVVVQMTVAVLAGGLVAALFGLSVGIPSLRLRGDYLAMVTLGFGEAIRYVSATDQGTLLTNGGLGIRGVPAVFGGPFAAYVWLVVTLWFLTRFTQSSYGRALKSIREDELAAQAMGINIAYHKVLAFGISAAFAGIAGGLYASWLGTIDPNTFQIFLMTYLLVAVSVGGAGSNTGAVLGTALVVLVRQYLQPLEQSQAPGPLIGWAALATAAALFLVVAAKWRFQKAKTANRTLWRIGVIGGLLAVAGVVLVSGAAPWPWFEEPRSFVGLRNLLLGVCLLLVMIYRPLGALGRSEFGWGLIFDRKDKELSDTERSRDAWLTGEGAAKKGGPEDVSHGGA